MDKARRLAWHVLRTNGLTSPTLENLVFLISSEGYELIDYDESNPDLQLLFDELRLTGDILRQNAFLYRNGDVKLLFVHARLDAQEKRYALAHELGHIMFGHRGAHSSVSEEHEANEFAHYLLYPPAALRAWIGLASHKVPVLITLFVLTCLTSLAGIMVGRSYSPYYVTGGGSRYHLASCPVIRGKTNLHHLKQEELEKGMYSPCRICLPDEVP